MNTRVCDGVTVENQGEAPVSGVLAMQVTQNVLDSSAVAVLCDLEHAGLDLAVVDGRLRGLAGRAVDGRTEAADPAASRPAGHAD